MADLKEVTDKYRNIDETLLVDRDIEERDEILKEGMKWSAFVGTYISQEELQMITDFEVPHFDKADVMRKHGRKYARLFMILLSRLKKDLHLRYAITLVNDVLETVPDSSQYFFELSNEKPVPGVPDLPFGPLFAVLSRTEDDPYIVSKASSILTFFLVSFPKVRTDMVESSIHWFIKKLGEEPDAPNYTRVELKVLRNLRTLLKVPKYRLIFARESGVEPLFELTLLNDNVPLTAGKIEIEYQALYCLWLLSYHNQVQKVLAIAPLFSNLCHLLRVCQERDKVVRVVLALLRNLSEVGDNKKTMLSCGLERILAQLKSRSSLMADKDVAEDITFLEGALDTVREELTSFDVYLREVQVRSLDWSSPVHKSEKFWRENCLQIENAGVLQMLKNILDTEDEANILCVACWDIGEFIQFHPHGKVLVQQVHMKEPIMRLLSHKDSKVSSQALLTLQKLMVTNWEYLLSQ